MHLLQSLHDELKHLRDRAHELVTPEQTIGEKLHQVVDEVVTKLHEFEARIAALELRFKNAEDAVLHPNAAAGSSGGTPPTPEPQPATPAATPPAEPAAAPETPAAQ